MRLILSIVVAMLTLMGAKAEALDEFARSYVIADSLHSIGRTDSAVMVGAETIALAKGMNNSTMLVAAHSSQGVFLRSLGLVDETLDIYGKALDISNSGVFGDNPDADAGNENWACAVRRRVGKRIQGACAPMAELALREQRGCFR